VIKRAEASGVLALMDMSLTAVPIAVEQLTGLRHADLSSNRLTSVPAWLFTHMGKLQKLNLHRNSLHELPSASMLLPSLLHLNISSNRLTALPESICALTKLRDLNASHNLIDSLPSGIDALAALEDLDLSHNRLTEDALPYPSFFSMPALMRLNLSHNALRRLPVAFSEMARLVKLDVSHNKIASVPPEVLRDSRLNELWLQGNAKALDRVSLKETEGIDAFLERRKRRIDKKIDSKMADIDLNLCGLE